MIDREPKPRVLRLFGAVWTPLALFSLAIWLHRRSAGPVPIGVVLGVALVALILGLLAPRSLRMIYVALSFATAPIGWLVSRVALVAIYTLLITPIGLLLRLFGRDALGLGERRASYWSTRGEPRDSERHFRQY